MKGSNIYAIFNSGSGWSSPVQTTAVAQGNPALLDLITDIVLIYKGTDGQKIHGPAILMDIPSLMMGNISGVCSNTGRTGKPPQSTDLDPPMVSNGVHLSLFRSQK